MQSAVDILLNIETYPYNTARSSLQRRDMLARKEEAATSKVPSTIDYTPGTEASPPTRTAGPAPPDRDTPRTNADNCVSQFVNSFFPSSSFLLFLPLASRFPAGRPSALLFPRSDLPICPDTSFR